MQINSTPTFIGTSGYKYDDWKGTFIPADTMEKDLLATWQTLGGFNFLEITYTFYKLPEAEATARFIQRAPEDLSFSIRLFKDILNKKKRTKEMVETFLAGVKPILDSGRVAAIFGDFKHDYSASKENFANIIQIRKMLPAEIPFFVELPHRTWYKERVFQEFTEAGIGLITLDLPPVSGFAPYYPVVTNYHLYMRLHGKSSNWLVPDGRDLNYSYSEKEMKRFFMDAVNKSALAHGIFISFCNVEQGNAAIDAAKMTKMVRGKNAPVRELL